MVVLEIKKLAYIGFNVPEELREYNPVIFTNSAAATAMPELAFVVEESEWEEAERNLKGVKKVRMSREWLRELTDREKVFVWRTRVVAVTGSEQSGKTLLSCLLGAGAKACGLKPLIVDFDAVFGGSDISFYFRLPRSPNWNTFLSGEKLKNSVVPTPVGDILQMSPVPAKITEENVKELLRQAKLSYDLIVFDLNKKYRDFASFAEDIITAEEKQVKFDFPFLRKTGGWNKLGEKKEAIAAGQEILKEIAAKNT